MQMSVLPHDVAPAWLSHDHEQAEEVELDAIAVEQHALGTEGAVDEARRMGGVQPIRDRLEHSERVIRLEWPSPQEVGERSRRERLGGDEQASIRLADLADAQKRRMAEPS